MNITSIPLKAQNFYLSRVKYLFLYFHNKNWTFFACAIAAFLIEPYHTLKAAYLMRIKRTGRNINPASLTADQINFSPVLLIHGDSSNSGLFAPMIQRIIEDNPNKPIFTIDLVSQSGIVSEKEHLSLILDKVWEISQLYPALPSISLVGHSSGGDILAPLVQAMEKERFPLPKVVIKIGSLFKNQEEFILQTTVLEIVGTKDVFEGCESLLPKKLVVASGHLGLLFHDAVLERVSKEIHLE